MQMTPARIKALEWVRDNGNVLELPDRYEPSKRMLLALDRDELIRFHSRGFNRTWDITRQGLAVLEPKAVIPLTVLKWWRELVDLNPADLAPRMDEYIKRLEDAK